MHSAARRALAHEVAGYDTSDSELLGFDRTWTCQHLWSSGSLGRIAELRKTKDFAITWHTIGFARGVPRLKLDF